MAALLLAKLDNDELDVEAYRRDMERMGRELHGSVLGLLGLAPTAHALAPMLKALGVRVVGYDPAIHHSEVARVSTLMRAMAAIACRSDTSRSIQTAISGEPGAVS